MKKVIAVLMTLLTLCLFSANIFAADIENTPRDLLSGANGQLRSVTTQCPNCGQSGFVLSCGGISIGNAAEVYCSISSHQPCIITDRNQYTTMGSCGAANTCHLGNGGQYGTYQYGVHIESCKHTRMGDYVYNTCSYK